MCINNQRRIIKEVTKRPAKETPQIWALYKEVQDYYDAGLRVPDDVTILLCDDNWGNVETNTMRTKPGKYEILYGTSSLDKDLKKLTITL